jgi:two-component system OmpR family sensor kinase
VRFDELVRDSFEDAQTLGQPRQLQATLPTLEPALVKGDRHRLRRLAADAGRQRGEVLRPGRHRELRPCGANQGQAELVLSNTGPGLAPELQPRVFERFFRGDARPRTMKPRAAASA